MISTLRPPKSHPLTPTHHSPLTNRLTPYTPTSPPPPALHDHDDNAFEYEPVDDPTDEIAQVAARLLETGAAGSVSHALTAAVRELGWQADVSSGRIAMPSLGRVRAHARGFAQSMLGQAGYDARVVSVLTVAEMIMTVLEDHDPVLVGRAAQGQIDAGVTLYLRVHVASGVSIGDLAATLVEHEYEEPSFLTAQTKHGRFSRLAFEEAGIPVVLTRCLRDQRRLCGVDLFSGKRLHSLDLQGIRDWLEAHPG